MVPPNQPELERQVRSVHDTTRELLETEHERQLKTLHETTRQLSHAADRDEIAEILAETASAILRYPLNIVWLPEDSQELHPAAVTRNLETEVEAPRGGLIDSDDPIAKTYVSGEPAYHDDLREVPGNMEGDDIGSAIYLPLGQHGVLSLVDTTAGAFDLSDRELAALLAAIGESALDRLHSEQNRTVGSSR